MGVEQVRPPVDDTFPAVVGELPRAPVLLAAPQRQRRAVLDEVLGALTAHVEEAGGEVAARYELLDRLVGGSSTSLVDTLGQRLAGQGAREHVSIAVDGAR